MSTDKNRQRKTKDPCPVCGLARPICICELLPCLELSTRVVLVVHAKELKRTTNSGRLAIHMLKNSEVRIRGEMGTAGENHSALDLSDLGSSQYHSLVFYPSQDAVELNEDFVRNLPRPVQLIVPDGNWRQAGKVESRHKEIAHLPRVMIRSPNLAKNHLRKESSEYGMSTLEAIAKAIAVLEGPVPAQALLTAYDMKLRRTIKARGQDFLE